MAGQMLYVKKKEDSTIPMDRSIISKDNEYYTPKYVIDFFYPDGFDYDPATCIEKAVEFGVEHYDTIETDGLKQDWTKYDRIWVNPPFANKYEFLKKAVETYNIAHNIIYVLFPIEFLTANKFHNLDCHFKLYIPKGRVNFESGLGKKGKSPAFGSIIVRLAEEDSVEYVDLKSGKNIYNYKDFDIETIDNVVNSTTIKKSWYK